MIGDVSVLLAAGVLAGMVGSAGGIASLEVDHLGTIRDLPLGTLYALDDEFQGGWNRSPEQVEQVVRDACEEQLHDGSARTCKDLAMVDLDLRPGRRELVAARLVAELESAVTGSTAGLRGSLASGSADGLSDIDVLWIVPDNSFAIALDVAEEVLGAVRPVSSLRIDPGLARSDRRRLLFVRFAGLPVFWRVDLDVRASSVGRDDRYDDDNPAARSDVGWSRPGSAIENATAAVKAAVRHQDDTATGLLSRGFARIRRDPGPLSDLPLAITTLADLCATDDPSLAGRAAELHQIVDALVSAGQLPSF